MRHPAPGELLDLHFAGEGAFLGETAAHVRACPACRAFLEDVAWAESALEALPDAPPADGLDRVLARIEAVRPARKRREHWLRAFGPSVAGLLAGGLAAHQGGVLALVAFLALGSLLTLALAPVLILESQRRS